TGAFLFALAVTGCTTLHREPVPLALIDEAMLDGYGPIRFWGDRIPPEFTARSAEALRVMREQNADLIAAGDTVKMDFLAISGGGGNGAFGAGFLNGWTRSGTRPEFQIVTGVSTGAIIAPFAFLGPDYDDELRRAYTEIGPDDIYVASILPNLFNGVALANAAPLKKLIASFSDSALLDAIAREHMKGRRLLVVTTNIDAGRAVVWDLGAIAASGNPGALSLFREILLASASLPGLFPPVAINVVAEGRHFTEFHVDGGLTSQVFSYQPQIELGRVLDDTGFDVDASLYVIWNGRRVPVYAPPEPVWYALAERSLDVQFTHQGLADIDRMYGLSQRDGMDFHLATIPEDFAEQQREPFEQNFMRALFQAGEVAALAEDWLDAPPE
ncbi:MAG: hypothetical protein RJB62_383, partial [Pseudomonadota bacterium]